MEVDKKTKHKIYKLQFSCLFEHGSIQSSGEPHQARNVKACKGHGQWEEIPNKVTQPSKSNGRL